MDPEPSLWGLKRFFAKISKEIIICHNFSISNIVHKFQIKITLKRNPFIPLLTLLQSAKRGVILKSSHLTFEI